MEIKPGGQEKDLLVATVRSAILKSSGEAQVEASAELHAHLGQMVNNPDFSDVVFLCNDGKEVQASRMLLAGRSAVLKSMLLGDMAESSLSSIPLPEISSEVLLRIFEYLYTGTLSDNGSISWRLSWEIINASRFFLLPSLETIIRKLMINHTSLAAKDLVLAASLLTEATEVQALCDETDISLRELVTILSYNWSESVYFSSLSEDAFQYLIKSTRNNCDDFNELSFEEYLRFRQVIRWWVRQDDQTCSRGELLNFVTPDEGRALSVYRNLKPTDRIESQVGEETRLSNEWISFQRDEVRRNSAAKLFSNIDFRRIHPVLLATVVEPMSILSAADIFSAFRFHALRQSNLILKTERGWDHDGSHKPVEQSIIMKNSDSIGTAVMMPATSCSYALYQWQCVVEELPYQFCELGIISTSEWAAEKASLKRRKLSESRHARVLQFSLSGGHYGLENSLRHRSRAVFKFDAYKHTCSLLLDGRDFGVIWKDIPKGLYYPAASLGSASNGRVRIELISGFNIH